MKAFLELISPFLPIIYALLILAAGLILAKWAPRLVIRAMQRKNVDPTLYGFVKNLLKVVILIFMVLSIAGALGLPIATFIAALGAAGVAVGLALKDYLANFASGIVLIVLKPFHVGDFIEADDITGTVKSIELMYTHLTTPDNKEIILPNTMLTNDRVVNYSANEIRRLGLLFAIGYQEDIDHAKRVLLDLLADSARALDEPEPVIGVEAQGPSSITLAVWVWCKGGDYIPLKHELNQAVKERFAAEHIAIPFPQMDVHMGK